MKRIELLLVILLVGALLFSCAPKPVVEPVAPETSEPVSGTAKEGWVVEWEKLMSKAKNEGRVTVASGFDADTRAATSKAVKDKLNLETEWIVGRGADTAARIRAERNGGLYTFDIYLGGANTGLTSLKPLGALLPLRPLLILPEVLDAKAWFGNRLPFIDREQMLFRFWDYTGANIARNTDLVRKDEIKSYKDMLNPKWKGKILMEDPTVFGSAGRWAGMIGEYFPELGWDFQRALARQEPVLSRDKMLLATWLARGKYSLYLGAKTEPTRMKELGAPIELVFTKDGNYGSAGFGNLAVFDKAPHPSAALVFANWVLSREGQEIISRARGDQSGRIDVPIDHLIWEMTREFVLEGGGTYMHPPEEEFNEVLLRVQPIIKDIWGKLAGR